MVQEMLVEADDYYWTMAARGRLFYLERAGEPWGLCTFFVLPSADLVHTYHERPLWSTPPDVADGPIVYIDKLVGRSFDRALFDEIEAALIAKVPGWHQAIWHQPASQGPDRMYTHERRGNG